MSIQYKVIGALVALIVAFGVGRYSATSQKPTVAASTTVKTDIDIKTDEDVHKVTTITKKPSGEVTTVITEDTDAVVDQKTDQTARQDVTVTPPKANTLNLSGLVGVDPLNSFKPLYGLGVTKQVLGPMTIGAWALTNSTVGISVGINF